jgi:hypothetical protein
MARDIVPLDPDKATCPWCNNPVLIGRQLAVYEDGDDLQITGLSKGTYNRTIKSPPYPPTSTTIEQVKDAVAKAPPKRVKCGEHTPAKGCFYATSKDGKRKRVTVTGRRSCGNRAVGLCLTCNTPLCGQHMAKHGRAEHILHYHVASVQAIRQKTYIPKEQRYG